MQPLRRIAAALCVAAGAQAAQSPQTPIEGSAIPQFIEPLPTLGVAGGSINTLFGNQPLTLTMCEFRAHVLPAGTFAPGQKPETWVWGYVPGTTCPSTVQDTYVGPVIVNSRGSPTEITFINQLGSAATTNVLAYKYSTDQTLDWADPLNGGANACNKAGGIPAFGSPCAQNYAGPVPVVPHLHGGEVPPMLDGGPDAWFLSDALGTRFGHDYYTRRPGPANQTIYAYPNLQQAAPIWFHDHTDGTTRLNVFAGLAGAYYIVDPAQKLPAGFPGVAEVVPIVLQDRMFDTNGQLYFPSDSSGASVNSTNPQHPYWVPEFVGDTIVVNGKAWPFFAAQPKRYRFLLLNGSNSRAYELFLANQVTGAFGPPMWVIGNDSGYLDAPAKLDPAAGQKLLIMPGERYEVIIDFAGVAPGTTFILKNTAKAPFPTGAPAKGSTVGRILQFRIACPPAGCPVDSSWNPATPGATIRQSNQLIQRLVNPATGTLAAEVTADKTRQLTLNEVELPASVATDPVTGVTTEYPGGPVDILLNNTKMSGESPRPYRDFVPIDVGGKVTFYSELPQEGDTEVWEIVNLTPDAHPIHTHLASFQVLNRQAFDLKQYNAAYAAAFPAAPALGCAAGSYCADFGPPLDYNTGNPRALGGNPDVTPFLKGKPLPPRAQETGWKDTLMVPPGAVTRFVVRWAPSDLPIGTPKNQLVYAFDPSDNLEHGYVWHCHMIDHEDNEMMRPDVIQLNPAPGAPAPAARPLVKGVAY